jgi:hypothetical protein
MGLFGEHTSPIVSLRPRKPSPSIRVRPDSALVSSMVLSEDLLEITSAVGLVLGTLETLTEALLEVLPTIVILKGPGGAVDASSSSVPLQIMPESQILASSSLVMAWHNDAPPPLSKLAISFLRHGFLNPRLLAIMGLSTVTSGLVLPSAPLVISGFDSRGPWASDLREEGPLT